MRDSYRKLGYKTLTVWECALNGKARLTGLEIGATLESWILYDPQDAQLFGRPAIG